MHILLLVNSYITERDQWRGWKFKLHLEAYSARGWKVGLVALFQRDYGLLDCLRNGGLIVEEGTYGAPVVRNCERNVLTARLPFFGSIRRASRRIGVRTVKYYISRYGRPDVIHAHGSQWAGLAANAVQEMLRVPYVVTEHMSNYATGGIKQKHIQWMRKVFSEARMRIPIGESTGRVLEDLFGNDFRPWSAIPNMMDPALFRKATLTSARGDRPFIFLSLARLDPIKGFDNMLRAFAISFRGRDVRLRIGGDGPLRGELGALAESLGIGQQVEFLGRLSRDLVADEFGRADAYVLSSRYETFAIPILEAHASGVPVVATACGGPQHLVDDSNGILVTPGDVAALAEGLRHMVRVHAEFDRNAIRERCRATYAPEVVLDRLEGIYNEALSFRNGTKGT